jgi:glycosyltransferase involved in cell wall biosynthesis
VRLLMVSHAFLPYSNGGVEICTAYSALALQRRGHEVHVFYRIEQPERPEYEVRQDRWRGLPVATINNTFAQVNSFEMTYRNRAVEQALTGYLDRLQPDLVHFQHLTCLSTGLIEVAKTRELPTVLTLHDYWLVCQRGQMLQPNLTLCAEPEDAKCARCLSPYIYSYPRPAVMSRRSLRKLLRPLASLAARLYTRYGVDRYHQQAVELMSQRTRHVHDMMRQVDLLITPSHFHRSQFVRLGLEPDHIVVQPNGHRSELFRDFRHIPSDHLRFCYLGSIIPSKGVHVLVEAFNNIQGERATLDIYGWAPSYEGYPNYFQDLRAKAGPRVRFHGGYNNDRVAEILAHADVVVVPSIWYENSPVTIHEAFLARVPVIGSRLGAIPEFVRHEVNGLLFEPRNAVDLRAQMERLLADPDLRTRLAQNPGPVKTMNQQAAELEAIYQRLIQNVGHQGSAGGP